MDNNVLRLTESQGEQLVSKLNSLTVNPCCSNRKAVFIPEIVKLEFVSDVLPGPGAYAVASYCESCGKFDLYNPKTLGVNLD